MKQAILLLLTTMILSADTVIQDDTSKRNKAEIEKLSIALESLNDSLHRLTSRRYSFRQQAVEQREADKSELERIDEQLARFEDDLSRSKEERFSREQVLAEEKRNLLLKRDEWTFLRTHLGEVLQKEALSIAEVFPLDKEQRREDLEAVRSMLDNKRAAGSVVKGYARYRLSWMQKADTLQLTRAVVAPAEGAPVALFIARFGSVAGYGLDTVSGDCYYIRQTGRIGNDKFTIDKIGAPVLAETVRLHLTTWMHGRHISGSIPFDVMQNDQSALIISGKEKKPLQDAYESFAKGGLVMIPLLFLPLWVLVLVVFKLLHFIAFSNGMKSVMKQENNRKRSSKDKSDAVVSPSPRNHALAEIAAMCVSQAPSLRHVTEKKAAELAGIQMHLLSRNLNTLAVIAGAAPLLGLLGTISGMITLFAAVTHYGTGDPKFLAGGISEALITAKTGLAIAIPVLFIHDFLRGMRDRLLAAFEKNSNAMLDMYYPEE